MSNPFNDGRVGPPPSVCVDRHLFRRCISPKDTDRCRRFTELLFVPCYGRVATIVEPRLLPVVKGANA